MKPSVTVYSCLALLSSMATSHTAISVKKHYDFNTNTTPSGLTVQNGPISYSDGEATLNGTAWLTGSSGISAAVTTDYGFELFATATSLSTFNFLANLTKVTPGGTNIGVGIVAQSGRWDGIINGVAAFSGSANDLNTEHHFAFVRTGSTNTLYVDGLIVATNSSAPTGTVESLSIGAHPTNGSTGTGVWNGKVNEVRTFTFENGAFSPDDLLFQAPGPFKSVVDYGGGSVTDNGAIDPAASPAGNHGLDKVSDGINADTSLYLTKTISALGTSSPPTLILDLGADRILQSMALWSYLSTTNNNAVKDFGVKFATHAEGSSSFSSSVTYNPIFTVENLTNADRQVFNFSETVTARYIQLTLLTNHGGDRYGLSEVQFADVLVAGGSPGFTAITPTPITDSWWSSRHTAKLIEVQSKPNNVDMVFVGDSITHFWSEKADQPFGHLFEGGLSIWNQYFIAGVGNSGRKPINLGYGGDTTENILWRLQHGEMQGIAPKVAVVLAGTNNTGLRPSEPASETALGVQAIIREIRLRSPSTKILLHGITPREASPTHARRIKNNAINAILQTYTDNEFIFYLNLDDLFLNGNGTVNTALMPDNLHPNLAGYAAWAPAMEPTIDKLFGVVNSGVDTDTDGIDDGWEILHFGNTTTATASSNQDGDTHSDLDEFLFLTNPTDTSDFAMLKLDNNQLEFDTVTGVNYRLQSSPDLVNWTDEGNVIAGDGTEQTLLTIPSSPTSLFYRVRIN